VKVSAHGEHVEPLNPDSAVQSDAGIKRQALQSECNGPAAYSGLQSPVLQRTPGNIASPGPSTLDRIEIVRFCAFAPPGSPLDRYALSISTAEFGLKLERWNGRRTEAATVSTSS
jgi:hypothetical protein